jgi:hypothetical protein
MNDSSTRAMDSDALPRPDVVGLRHRIAYDFPSQEMAHLPKLGSFTVPYSADV